MSSVYVLEPPTKGKVILQTSYGPLDIELWPKEAPKAVRNFVQLCLEGYFDNTIFHRIIKSFLVQAGDPTGTGTGGESIYGGVFSDEFHSRLRFNHRGLVACANSGSPHSNGSQFFISLDRCDWLDKKNTIFGKVTGDSIYNLLRLGDVETDNNDRPLDPAPRILSVEVLWNPFDDLEPRVPLVHTLHFAKADTESKETKRRPSKKLNLLSFGEEAEEEEQELNMVKQKIKSSHDLLDDPRLLKDDAGNKELIQKPSDVRRDDIMIYTREALSLKPEVLHGDQDDGSYDSTSHSDDDDKFDAQMRQQIIRKRKELGDLPIKQMFRNGRSSVREDTAPVARAEEDEASKDNSGLERLFMKRKGIGSEARAERMVEADVDLQLLNEAERGRQRAKQKKRRLQGRQDEVLEALEEFKKGGALGNIMSSSTNGKIQDGSEDTSEWRSAPLKFAPDSNEDGMSRREDPNDYVVKDPLMEKGKEKFNRMQARQKRRDREWAGRSLT